MERLTNHDPCYQPYVITANKPTWRSIYDKLCAYEDAEEQGLLVRLPCKVGTPCWKVWQFGGEFGVTDWVFNYDDISQFGITVFLNHEEAEAALAKEG